MELRYVADLMQEFGIPLEHLRKVKDMLDFVESEFDEETAFAEGWNASVKEVESEMTLWMQQNNLRPCYGGTVLEHLNEIKYQL